MKAVVALVGLFAIALASTAQVKLLKQQQTLIQSTKEILQLQRAVLRLFRNVHQPNHYNDQANIAENYDIETNIASYNNPEAVTEFMDLNRLGFLPKDVIFSIFNEQHRREAISLFKILYYANDFITLYRTACWARVFMNEGLFVYSLSVALVQRSDTAMIELPPIYEIYPEYFYNDEVIQEAKKARQLHETMTKSPFEQKPWQRQPWQKPIEEASLMGQKSSEQKLQEQLRGTQFGEGQDSPTWYNLLPESMRAQQQWFLPWGPRPLTPEEIRQEQIRQEMMRQEQLRQEQMRQEQIRQEQMMKGKLTIEANYSEWYNDEEHAMAYFTEDVGLNAYYYYYNIYFPFWLSNDMINMRTERRGEQFCYMIQQLLARYCLERLSNGLGRISMLDYNVPIRTGYSPSLTYPNGLKFPERSNNLWVTLQRAIENQGMDDNYTNSYMFIRDYERRIRDAIDVGYVITSTGKQIELYDERGFEILGNIIEGNPESPNTRFYGCLQIFARYLLGNTKVELEKYKIAPSVLEHFETSLRDPVFYQFCKRMLMYCQRYLKNIPPYSTKELLMPGIKIEDVQVDPLVTYFDYHYADISNAVYDRKVDESLEDIPVIVKQKRLNNKPFKYVLNIMSDKPCQALVKVFLGPKYDASGLRIDDINDNRLNFVELDKFPTALNLGVNRIERNSQDNFYSRDRTTYKELYTRVMMDMNRLGLPQYEPREPEWGIPKRLLLPKGTTDGQTYQMYFIITPYQPVKEKISKKQPEMPLTSWRRVVDNYPLGFPLDRPIDESIFYVPNSFFKDVIIYHKEMKNTEQRQL